eukprot:1072057-Ditylum_brightwellii.AAC.1
MSKHDTRLQHWRRERMLQGLISCHSQVLTVPELEQENIVWDIVESRENFYALKEKVNSIDKTMLDMTDMHGAIRRPTGAESMIVEMEGK